MATPPFLNGQSSPPPPPQRPTKAAKTGRAKKPNNKNPKKLQQRGMGVAKLERLRLQEERWKRMTEIKSENQTQYLPISPTEMVPLRGYPVQWNYASGAPMIISGGGFGSCHSSVDPYGSGAPERMRFNDDHHHVLEPSEELSSMPNLPHSQSLLLDCCCNNVSCFKKKRTNQENLGDKFTPETKFSMNEGEFIGLSLDNNVNGGINRFDITPTHELNKGVEVVAVRRKAKGIMGGSAVMEYDFLPRNNGRSTPSKELSGFPIEGASSAASSVFDGGSGEASYTTAAFSSGASNPVDLSLKLSF